jgi:metal-sulfur cluster biosynthetic enzyme
MNDLVAHAWDALKMVLDPEAGLNIVDLGLIYDIGEISGGVIDVAMTFTTESCPAGPILVDAAEAALRAVPGVTDVHVTIIFDPPWTPDLITPDGKAWLRI